MAPIPFTAMLEARAKQHGCEWAAALQMQRSTLARRSTLVAERSKLEGCEACTGLKMIRGHVTSTGPSSVQMKLKFSIIYYGNSSARCRVVVLVDCAGDVEEE